MLARQDEILALQNEMLVRHDGGLARRDEELAEYRRESAHILRLILRIAEKNGWLDENGDISSPF